MDRLEFRLRLAEQLLAQHRHEVALEHADLQRRFVFALSVGGAVVVASLRAEVPPWLGVASAPFFIWAWHERRKMRDLLTGDTERARYLLEGLRRSALSEASSSEAEDSL